MFTGIVDHVGRIAAMQPGNGGCAIETAWPPQSLAIGGSVACSGVCLTVTGIEPLGADGCRFTADISEETLARTTARHWRPGARLNLERALRLGDELGGHMVLGHVDGVAEITGRLPDSDSQRFRFAAPAALRRFIAPKGSVTLDGVSLTVNEVTEDGFGVNMVPHTLARTCFGDLAPGAQVNIEVDALARYVARLLDT